LKYVNSKCFEKVEGGKKAISHIISRMQLFPLNEEAAMIGALTFADGVIFSHSGSLVGLKELELFKQAHDKDEFLVNTTRGGHRVYWPHAVVEQASPNYFSNRYLKERFMQPGVSTYQTVALDFILSLKEPLGRIGLYGYGIRGRRLLKLVWSMGFDIGVIIDKSHETLGMRDYGIMVISPERSVGLVDTYIISTPKYSDEITNDIRTLHVGKKQPDILVFD
jgi:hypothetical protein